MHLVDYWPRRHDSGADSSIGGLTPPDPSRAVLATQQVGAALEDTTARVAGTVANIVLRKRTTLNYSETGPSPEQTPYSDDDQQPTLRVFIRAHFSSVSVWAEGLHALNQCWVFSEVLNWNQAFPGREGNDVGR